MKLRHFYPCLLFAGIAVTMASCSEEATLTSGQGRNVTMTVNISRMGDATRSILSEEAGDLKCTWEASDLVLVVDNVGNKLGVLHLTSGAGEVNATFTGEINTAAEGETKLGFLYLGSKTEEEIDELPNTVTFSYAKQDGSLDWLSSHDFFTGTQEVNITNSYVSVENVTLARQLAFGKFDIQLPEGVNYEGQDITVSGTGIYTQASVTMGGVATFSNTEENGGVITVKPVTVSDGSYSSSFYLTVLPNSNEQIEPTFSVSIDGTEYSCTLDPRTWTASEFVRAANGDGSFSGIKLEMTPPTVDTGEDNTVGPVIEIDGKKYKFVKGNLYYDMNDASWHLYEKETHFATLAGTSSFYEKINLYQKGINGKGISDSNHIIDLFAWGATGLGDASSTARAKLPDVIRQGTAGESTWAGSNWPTYNTNTMDVNGNANITDLWKLYTFEDPIYDFGYAYMQNGRPAGDSKTYVTAPLAAYAYICDQSRSFSQGCTVKGAGLNGEDVKGALIILGVTTAAEAQDKIEAVGGSVKNLKKLNVSVNNAGFDFQITLPDYESIEKLGAMFFALAGSSNWMSGKQQLSTDCGNYWTKDGAKGSSSDANGYSFFFRKSSSASEFHWVVGRNGVSKTRRTQNSVRLMVEVED
ncbi:MAG: hypothetical protein K2L17_08210 [Muribaculaceae bacterium]|nr:hypothetical protein [Muribaculaceae bacterium]